MLKPGRPIEGRNDDRKYQFVHQTARYFLSLTRMFLGSNDHQFDIVARGLRGERRKRLSRASYESGVTSTTEMRAEVIEGAFL